MSLRRVAPTLGLLVAFAGPGAGPAGAEGGLALGVPSDVAKDGVALGYSVRAADKARAEEVAMKFCRDAPVSVRARDLCTVVTTFTRRCVALSIDPQDGTAGFGWGIEDDKATAEASAMRRCRDTSLADRRPYCKITGSDCDR